MYLRLKDRPGSLVYGCLSILVSETADHECRLLEPARHPKRRQIRCHVKIAVPSLPVRQPVSCNWGHFHVHGQEVVAAVRAVRSGALQKERCIETFPHQPTVEIGECDQHRIDFVVLDQRSKLFQCEESFRWEHTNSPRSLNRIRCSIEHRVEQDTERAKGLPTPLRSEAKKHNMSVAVSHIDGRSAVVQVIFTEQVS